MTSATTFNADIGVRDGKIAAFGSGLTAEKMIDATDKLVIPGGVDIHVHMQMSLGDDVISADNFFTGSRAAAFGDIDLDGGVDILVVNLDGPAHLLHNVVPERGHWLLFDLREPDGSVALGARLLLDAGERTVVREVRSAFSYQAANDPRVHVGLGSVTEVSNVRVEWVDGEVTNFGDLRADGLYILRRGEAPRRWNPASG